MDSLQKNYLAETARWQKLLGVVMMVFTVLIALIGIFFIVAGSAFGDAMEGLDLFGGGMAGGIAGVAIGIVYILMAVLYYFFARYLLRSAKALKAYGVSDDEADLTEGLKNNKSYFKLSGILVVISLCILALVLVIAIIGAIVS
jgi:amino acid transporter